MKTPAELRLSSSATLAVILLTCGLLLGPDARKSAAEGFIHDTATAPAEGVINASDLTFHHRVLAAKIPVLVDFWAPWCVPCRGFEASLARVAADLGGQVRIVRVNFSRNPLFARRYKIAALPTTLVFMRGELVDRGTGALSVDDLRDLLASAGGPARAPAADSGAVKVAALSAVIP